MFLLSDSCPNVGTGCLLQFSHLVMAGPVLLTLLFLPLVPLTYQVLHDFVYSFPLLRYSCPLSAGVLQALLCLKVYSWYIREDRCTPRPTTLPPSCSPLLDTLNVFFTKFLGSFSMIATNLCQQDWQDTIQVHMLKGTAMATHSSTLAWKIPWTEEPGRLHSMGSQRFQHDWVTKLNWTDMKVWSQRDWFFSHFVQDCFDYPGFLCFHIN